MARARFIRPEFFTDDKVGALSLHARLLYPSIWCQADLRGVFEWNPKQLRAHTFPYDEAVMVADVVGFMGELEAGGMIVPFQVDGKEWGYVRKWRNYQSFTTSEKAASSKRPLPPTDSLKYTVRPESDSSQTAVIPLTLTPTLPLTPTHKITLTPESDEGTSTAFAPLGRTAETGGKKKPKAPEAMSPEEEIRLATAKALAYRAEREAATTMETAK